MFWEAALLKGFKKHGIAEKISASEIFEYYFMEQLANWMDSLRSRAEARAAGSKEYLQAKRAHKYPDQWLGPSGDTVFSSTEHLNLHEKALPLACPAEI